MNPTQRFRIAALLAAAAGWLSLSHEILWVKVLTSAWRSSPMAFGTTLGSFLVGVATGAMTAPRMQRRLGWSELHYCAVCLGLAGLSFWLLPAVGSWLLLFSGGWGMLTLHASVAVVAALMGGMLPLVARLGVSDDADVGANVSIIYFANVLGSTAGPLFTGFVMLEWFTIERAIFVVAIAGLAIALVVAWVDAAAERMRVLRFAGAAAFVMTVSQGGVYSRFIERVHFHSVAPDSLYAYRGYGRAGSIGVLPSGDLFSDGLYDGAYNVIPEMGSNSIQRAYYLALLHPNPRRVLEIGLGSASWARVISRYPDVESLTVVEINPRYTEAVQRFPEIAGVLTDPRVRLEIDDGRRWLRKHPHDVFDAIVVNTSWHWRANATHLLSAEFLREMRSHLAPRGIVYYNTTFSRDVMRTAAEVFAHVVLYQNFVAAGDSVFEMPVSRRIERLVRFPGPDGTGSLFAQPEHQRAMFALATQQMDDVAPTLRSEESFRVVTEDNMVPEFKTFWSGKWWRELPSRAFAPERGWLEVLLP